MKAATRNTLRDYGVAIAAAVTIALLIRIFIIEAYRIPTAAMHPTLEPGDTIFAMKTPIGFDRKQIRRGDVLIFSSGTEPSRDYIKRAIGLPGDTVEVNKGRVILNGKTLDEPPARKNAPCGHETLPARGPDTSSRSYGVCWEPPLNEDFGPAKVPANSIFVLGDLRSRSPLDTKMHRSWGIIPVSSVKGRARWIWLSIEPQAQGLSPSSVRFPHFRFDRMFRRIE